MSPKPPTPQAVSRLLAKAGFERAVISIRGGNSGFKAEKCRVRENAVKVRAYFQLRMPDESYRAMVRRYRDAIEAAGYSTEVATYYLIVTAKPEDSSVLAAKEGDPPMTELWTLLYDEIVAWQIDHNEVAAGLEGEGEDGAEPSARADELGKVLALMDHMEAGQ